MTRSISPSTFLLCLLVISSVLIAVCSAYPLANANKDNNKKKRGDPADSWLAYTVSKGEGKRVTWVNATWKVPDYPNNQYSGNAPGWWFGIEPIPADNLIQPILAWGYTSNDFTIFNGYYQWDDGYWWSSQQGLVKPGNTIYAYVNYSRADDSYDMFITCPETGFKVKSNIPAEDGKIFTDTYFVIEHQPDSCDGYPSNGVVTFADINIELDYEPVTPQWEAYTYEPACNSQAKVLSPHSVQFTWNPNA